MKTIAHLINDFQNFLAQYNKNMAELPRVMGKIAVDVVHENFEAQGYIADEAVIKWEKRSLLTDKTYDSRGKNYKGSVYSSSNPILRQTGNLYNAIRYSVRGKYKVFIGVNTTIIPYAQIHNEGLEGNAFGKYPFKMPQRKFIGISQKLRKRIFKEIQSKNKIAFKFLSK